MGSTTQGDAKPVCLFLLQGITAMRRKCLRDCLLDHPDSLSGLGDTIDTPHGPLTYIDNNAPVLAVVHRDTVRWNPWPKIKRNTVTYCPQLDDRLGLWVLLGLLPGMGTKRYDILITDSEEIGESTAQYFQPVREYNWMFEFDRAGDDLVFYQYESGKMRNLVWEYGFITGQGAFTDIGSLEHLGVVGMNIGTGYHRQHTPECHAKLKTTRSQAAKFAALLHDYHDIKLEWDGVDRRYGRSDWWRKYDNRRYFTQYDAIGIDDEYVEDWDDPNRNWDKPAKLQYMAQGDDLWCTCSLCSAEVDWLDTYCWDCGADLLQSEESYERLDYYEDNLNLDV